MAWIRAHFRTPSTLCSLPLLRGYVVRTPFSILFCVASCLASANDQEILAAMCERESRLNHFAVSCYVLGRGTGWDCHPQNLRRTSRPELEVARGLASLPRGCLSQVDRELRRRLYLNIQGANPGRPSRRPQFLPQKPSVWQEN